MDKKDNWIHKNKNMICNTCIFYVAKGLVNGRCRKHAPTLEGWPAVFATDWCGDYKLESVIETVTYSNDDADVDTFPAVDGFHPGKVRWANKDV